VYHRPANAYSEAMSHDKSQLRQQLLAARQHIDPSVRADKDATIAGELLRAHDWSSVRTLHIYMAIENLGEVDTSAFVSILRLRYPAIVIDIASASPDAPQPTKNYDVIIVPVLGYDTHHNRLGMGAGWYDRFLATQKTALTLGLAYTECQVDDLPTEPHDQPLERIISA
jgi:5-formyltetrahydrofolate cyclo-ligase